MPYYAKESPLMDKFENNILHLQITTHTVHTVKILSHSDCCITTDILYENPKKSKNKVLKRGLVVLANSQNQIFPTPEVFPNAR